jgi:nitrogen fixation-related uncharacterized protein
MTPMNKCQICEKPTQGTPLCVACESEVLKKQKGRSMVLSVAMGLIMIGAVYFVWNEYSGKKSQVDPTIVTGSLENFLATGTAILRSPFILAPVLLILIVVAFYWGVKLTK